MVLFQNNADPKYQLLDNPRQKCSFVAHSWAIFGLIILSISITIIFLIIIWDEIKQMQHKTETLDFVLFGPKREISDIIRFSEYRALTYALANDSSLDSDIEPYTPNDSVETFQHVEKKYSMVCYYVTPSRSSPQNQLYPTKIDPYLCTHIIVSFASLDGNVINFMDAEILETMAMLKSINNNLKLLISVVSFSSSEDAFSVMVSSKQNRKEFIDSVVRFMETHLLDGLDLDWEFPAWPPSRNITQKDQFVQLLEELREAFGHKYLLSVAVAAPLTIVNRAYDIPKVAKYVDFVNLMCYDYHSFVWYLPVTGPNAPLYAGAQDLGYFKTLNTNYTVHLWLKNGMPKSKIMMGMPLYGHSWTLMNPHKHSFGDLAEGFGSIGEKGFVSYRDVCKFIDQPDVHVEFDGETRVPYAYHQKEWFSYDDEKSLSYKAEYVTELGLGGAMLFSLNQDDTDGTMCTSKKLFPLTTRIKTVLDDQL